ncbi:MAG TPA: ATP-binding protein [Actinomycetota bacterium]|nr:ATP-binding protein [Actinomycetota bacterium]
MTQVLFAALGVLVGALVTVGILDQRQRGRLRTERVRAERAEASRETEARTSAQALEIRALILSSMEEGVLLFNGTGSRIYANTALTRHLGAVPERLDALLPLELQRAARRAADTGSPIPVEVETGAPPRWLRATARPVGGDGSVMLVVRDVTDARRLDAIRRDFVANASHELKTPVASIRAAAETLRDGAIDDPPAAQRFTEQLEREALRLSRIVSDLLDLSRLETGSELDERVHLDAIAADEVERLEDQAAEANVKITLHADGVPSIHGSARDIALLVRNLIDNAVRYTPAGGTVDVTVTTGGDDVIVRVTDTGVGIPRRDLPRVFERFYRVDRARSRETGGTGLGLAIVKHVAENHGGDVSVQSELANGSTFEVRIPVAGAVPAPGAP